ncbi:toll/interleukin-1 receptor domain-containing protein [Mycobacteroides abscessus]|uniref:toll/interleukin-1 receptor domain-containing protein n=1 Tax=Mycobacteroides abscessus TaxID=36809 RepID=UPI000C256925|nr:toll/interleukin-1 receptor domain-containing protein [Mycobacteroides abscessus]
MAIDQNLGIFISWSGELARQCTIVLREWLPRMFDHVDPWLSDVDIQPGDRSMDEIRSKLNDCGFGIIVVTTENMEKPWLNFEAGALSKSFGDVKNRVVPLLVNIEDMYQLKGPISQFQATMLNEAGMAKLCDSISLTIGLDLPTTRARFAWAWPDLAKGIARAKEIAGAQPELPDVDDKELLKDVYAMVRSLQEHQAKTEQSGAVARRIIRKSALTQSPPDSASSGFTDTEIKRLAATFGSEIKPVREVRIERNPPGQVHDLYVSFQDGGALNSEDYNQLINNLRPYTNYRLIVGG